MQHTLFIADLHLDANHSLTTNYYLNFIQNHAAKAEALYILGDFFELWIGDDYKTPFYSQIKTSLRSLSDKIPVYFMHGNRDFLVGKRFAKETGCILLPEFSVIELYGQKVLLLHGDAFCSLDERHMQFRRLNQSLVIKSLFTCLPLALRKIIGKRFRALSKQHHSAQNNRYLNVVDTTVLNAFQDFSVTKMIHGHIHDAKVVNYFLDQNSNKNAERIVLGSWDTHGCALKWYANGKREMCFFKE